MPVALVVEVVHLLGHDVGRLTDPAEHTEIFHQRWNDQFVSGGFDDVGEDRCEGAPATGFRCEDVTHPWARLERWHGQPGYRRPLDSPR